MNDLLTYLLGGSFVSALLGLFTIRSKIRKARAETESLNLDNSEKATEILMNNIVEPLKQELYEMRKEMALLRAAIRDARYCHYSADCPVVARLREYKYKQHGAQHPQQGGVHDDVLPVAPSCRGPDNLSARTAATAP